MIRLTFRENYNFGVVGMNEENQDKKLYACVLKLIDYEDTGLSPNDILKLKEENDSYNETMKYLNKLRDENNQLKQQQEEKNKEIARYKEELEQTNAGYDFIYEQSGKAINELKQLAIDELEKVNGILTDTIIEVTQDEMDLNKLCYLEKISAKFYEKMQEQIKQLENNKKDY